MGAIFTQTTTETLAHLDVRWFRRAEGRTQWVPSYRWASRWPVLTCLLALKENLQLSYGLGLHIREELLILTARGRAVPENAQVGAART